MHVTVSQQAKSRSGSERRECVLLEMTNRFEVDVILVRQRAKEIATQLGFDTQSQLKIATAVSEIVRNAFMYAHGGDVQFALVSEGVRQRLQVRVIDHGPGITNLDEVLAEQYSSPTGLGQGLTAARRLMDDFTVETSSRGTLVTLSQFLPTSKRPPTTDELRRAARVIETGPAPNVLAGVREQNRELIASLDQLAARNRELERLEAQLQARENEVGRLLRRDPLTGIANRLQLSERLPAEISRAARLRRGLSVILIDIDRFAVINERFGQEVGDILLHAVAQALVASVRPYDLVARVGGEEFLVLLPETHFDNARLVAERLCAHVNGLTFESCPAQLTVTCGVASLGDESSEALLERATAALAAAKRDGS